MKRPYNLRGVGLHYGKYILETVSTTCYHSWYGLRRQSQHPLRNATLYSTGNPERSIIYQSCGMVECWMSRVDDAGQNGKVNRHIARNIVKAEVCIPEHLSTEAKSVIKKLLRKDPEKLLRASKRRAKAVKKHPFRHIKWVALLENKVEPPFHPFCRDPRDTRNLDKKATSQAPVLSKLQEPRLTLEQQAAFQDLDWVADWAT